MISPPSLPLSTPTHPLFFFFLFVFSLLLSLLPSFSLCSLLFSLQDFVYKKFHVRDDEDEDLFAIFSQCHDFIETGRKHSGVFVHWYALFSLLHSSLSHLSSLTLICLHSSHSHPTRSNHRHPPSLAFAHSLSLSLTLSHSLTHSHSHSPSFTFTFTDSPSLPPSPSPFLPLPPPLPLSLALSAAGISRSACVVLSYLINRRQSTFDTELEYLR